MLILCVCGELALLDFVTVATCLGPAKSLWHNMDFHSDGEFRLIITPLK